MSAELLGIGEVARRTGIAVSAVRYYDDIGLVAAERIGGKRRFDSVTVGRVNFIRQAQDAGFALEEVRAILDDTAGDWRDVVDKKLEDLLMRRERLDAAVAMVRELRRCGCEAVAACARLDSSQEASRSRIRARQDR